MGGEGVKEEEELIDNQRERGRERGGGGENWSDQSRYLIPKP